MSEKAEASLINIIYERKDFPSGSYYEIFWYHWPRDGLLWWEDYEPVVFAYNYKHEICFALVRRGWKPIITNPEELFWPPEVRFKGGSHHQFIRMTTDYFGDFDQSNLGKLKSLTITSSRLTPKSSLNSIPDWNISGLNEDIHETIEKVLAESCEP